MHAVIVEVVKLVEELAETKRQLSSVQKEAEYLKRDAVDALRKEMTQALMESDIKREVALARLDAYEKMNNKDDEKKDTREMLKMAITALGGKSVPQQQKGGNQQQEKKD